MGMLLKASHHSGQTTGLSREHARDLSTFDHFLSYPCFATNSQFTIVAEIVSLLKKIYKETPILELCLK